MRASFHDFEVDMEIVRNQSETIHCVTIFFPCKTTNENDVHKLTTNN